jgi:dephospho-CoA kinase
VGRWTNKYVIGLTGNIATGKSVVRQMLQHLGAYTIDADGLSNQAMQPGAPAYKPVVEKFGMFILDEDKRIDRKALGNIVFSNPQALTTLESIVHPVVRQAVDTLVKRAPQRVIVIEAIKLVEGELGDWVDAIWVVDASPNTQLTRLVNKRKMTQDEASQRMKAQNPQSDKLARADVVIKNDGNVEETWKQVQTAWEGVKQEVIQRSQGTGAAAPAQKAAPPAPTPSGAISVRRGMPGNAEAIAKFLTKHSGKTVSRMDVMMSFGLKSYMIAEIGGGNVVSVLGWQVLNLITRADEFYIEPGVPKDKVIQSLVTEVESASGELQSEVAFIFLPAATPADTVNTFRGNGYDITGIRDIKVPAWREAVQETLSSTSGLQILMKKLREDRVLKPI